jgi:hypothetical protein
MPNNRYLSWKPCTDSSMSAVGGRRLKQGPSTYRFWHSGRLTVMMALGREGPRRIHETTVTGRYHPFGLVGRRALSESGGPTPVLLTFSCARARNETPFFCLGREPPSRKRRECRDTGGDRALPENGCWIARGRAMG